MPKLARPTKSKSRTSRMAGKRYPLNMRTTADVREKLVKAAARSGRSLAQEVEHQLGLALSAEGDAARLFALFLGDEPTAGLLMLIGRILSRANQWARDYSKHGTCLDDPATFALAREGIETLLAAVAPAHQGARATMKSGAEEWEQPSLGLPRTTDTGAALDPVGDLLGERLRNRLERANWSAPTPRSAGGETKRGGG